MNEDASFGLISGFNRLGKEVPSDVSVISIATSDRMGSMSDPVLTRLVSEGEALGRAASEALIDRLEEVATEPVQLLIPCKLHIGASTAPAPAR